MEAQRGEVIKGDKVHKRKSAITVKDPVIAGKGMGPASAFPGGLKAPTHSYPLTSLPQTPGRGLCSPQTAESRPGCTSETSGDPY